jgi:hypothetical protein
VSKFAIRSWQGYAIFIPDCYLEEKPGESEDMWFEPLLDWDSI